MKTNHRDNRENNHKTQKGKISIYLLSFLSVIFLLSLVSADLQHPQNYWRFNENNGSLISTDYMGLRNWSISSNNPDGHYTNFGAGKLNNAIIGLNSLGSSVFNTTNDGLFNFSTGKFTFVFWINKSNGGTEEFIQVAQANTGFSVETESNGTLCWVDSNSCKADVGVNVLNGNFHRVVFVREGIGANQFHTYIDGVQYENRTLNTDISDTTDTLNLAYPSGGNTYLDDFRIYNGYAWTPTDVTTDYNGGLGQELTISSVTLSQVTANNTAFNSSVVLQGNESVAGNSNTAKNMTIYIFNSTNGLYIKETKTLSGIENITTFSYSNISNGTYFWYLDGYDNAGEYAFTENRTFTFALIVPTTQKTGFEFDFSSTPNILLFMLFYLTGVFFSLTRSQGLHTIGILLVVCCGFILAFNNEFIFGMLTLILGIGLTFETMGRQQ